MKKAWILILCVCLLGLFIWKLRTQQRTSEFIHQQSIKIGTQSLSVEIAKTIPEITLGLGQRETLGSDGMLFVLPVRVIPTFWMKDMHFDLDFIWIDRTRVVDLTEHVSAQRGDPDYKLRVYSPRGPVTHVLEMESGAVKKKGINIGDTVQLSVDTVY